MSDRRNLHVRLSKSAYRGWAEFADSSGVTLGALVEAAGLFLGELTTDDPNTVERERMVQWARQIDRDRRSRRDG